MLRHYALQRTPALGPLELDVLDSLWDAGGGDAKALHESLAPHRGRSLSTVQSTLNRLHRKGLLTRARIGHAYRYVPVVTRQELIGGALADVLRRFSGGALEPLISSFVDLADAADSATLARLEALVAQLRGQRDTRRSQPDEDAK